MPSFRPTAVSAIIGAALAATQVAGQRPTLGDFLKHATLDNGFQVVVAENHAVPLATVLVAVHNGAMTQEGRDQGLAHLYEHLLFRSYEKDPAAFAQEATYLDADYNGSTSEEVVTYYLVLPSKNAVKGIALLAHLLQKPRFNERDLAEERGVVLDELQRAESDPEQALDRLASRLLWGASWSRKDVGGDSGSLKGISLDQLRTAYARYYVPNNSALIVTGDVSSENMVAAARDQFGAWPQAPDPFVDMPIPPIAQMTASSAALMAKPVAHATIMLKYRGPSAERDTTAPFAAAALCEVLNERGSLFQHHLVASGIFQSISCSYLTMAHVGPITFQGETSPNSVRPALAALLEELDHLGHLEGVTDEDLLIVRKRLQVRTALEFESSYALALRLAFWWALGGADTYARYDGRVGAQSLDDLRQFVGTYVALRPKVIGVLAPPAAIQGLQALLGAASGSQKSPR